MQTLRPPVVCRQVTKSCKLHVNFNQDAYVATPHAPLPPLDSGPCLLCQQFVPSLGLRIRPVLDLEPSISIVFVDPQLWLRHYPFQITTANLFEKLFAIALLPLIERKSRLAHLVESSNCERLLFAQHVAELDRRCEYDRSHP